MSSEPAYRRLTLEGRWQIRALLDADFSMSAIARQLGVAKSTICREIRRHTRPGFDLSRRRDSYSAATAHARYGRNRQRCCPHGKATPDRIYAIEDAIARTLSPEQIGHTLMVGEVSTATIYRWFSNKLLMFGDKSWLRRKGRRKRNSHLQRYDCGKTLKNRPEEANSRREFGHFEADSVMPGRGKGKACIFTFVERMSRKLFAFKSPACTAENMVRAVKMLQRSLPAGLVRSIATDRGSEFANFREIEALGIDVYFANPHSPWERGANENANGLLREFYPKGSSFTKISQHDLQWKAVWRINNRPRKCLNWKSAQETFAKMSLAVDRARALH